METELTLVSHHLCPYVQRALIVALETEAPLRRVDIDLANKPGWFTTISPTGKTPLLRVPREDGETILFESAAIAEYLDEIAGSRLMPPDPISRAQHRAWVEFASGTLNDIAGLYSATDEGTFERKRAAIRDRLVRLEAEVAGPWFAPIGFSLVDAAFGPVFRYFDVFEAQTQLRFSEDLPRLDAWRAQLRNRASVASAVGPDYADRLEAFVLAKDSHLSQLFATSRQAQVA